MEASLESKNQLNSAILVAFLAQSLGQLRPIFVGPPANFAQSLRDALNSLRLNLPPASPFQPFMLANCLPIAALGPSTLNEVLGVHDLPQARFMSVPPPTFDSAIVPIEEAETHSGYIFCWAEHLTQTQVYFLLAHTWGHLALGHLRQGDEFSHWDSLVDLEQPTSPVRQWDRTVQAWLPGWFETPKPSSSSVVEVEQLSLTASWDLPGWAEAFELLQSGRLDEPAQAIARVAHHWAERFLGLNFQTLEEAQLFPHQRRGAIELAERLQRQGVAILADAVGLGKTRTTATLIRLLQQNGLIRQAAILTPQKLEYNWQTELAELGLRVGNERDTTASVILVNKDKFKRYEIEHSRKLLHNCDLLVIEEAHQDLRNFSNKFHRNLSQVAQGKYGLLVTATPWNNRRGDIFAMLYPFVAGSTAPGRQGEFWNCFNLSQKDGLRDFEANDEAFRQIYALTTLQRTRRQLRETGEDSVFYAPRQPYLVSVPYSEAQVSAFTNLLERIEQLHLPHINLMRYLSGDTTENQLSGIQRSQLLKRAESSMYAFDKSLRALEDKLTIFLTELRQLGDDQANIENWVRRRLHLEEKKLSENGSGHETDQEVSRPTYSAGRASQVLEKALEQKRFKLFYSLLLRDCAYDLQVIGALRKEFAVVYEADPKLKAVLEQVNAGIAAGYKVLCISQYADTAWAVHQYLLEQPLLVQKGVGLVTGGKRDGMDLIRLNQFNATREEVLSRFAPHSWHRTNSKPRTVEGRSLPKTIDIVVGSDTLSVGQNLQDARVLINLDLCWNPMQHEQRIGRIDRPRHVSDSAPLDIYYFLNLELLEAELKLRTVLDRRLAGTYQDTEFDDEILPGYFEMIEQFRYLRQQKLSERHDNPANTTKLLVSEANSILEDITERSARPPNFRPPDRELEQEVLLQLHQSAQASLAQTEAAAPDTYESLLVTTGRIAMYDRQGLARSALPGLALAAELEFISYDQQSQPVGPAAYAHCYLEVSSETRLVKLETLSVVSFVESFLAEPTTRKLSVTHLDLLQLLLTQLQEYASQTLEFQRNVLQKARRLRRHENKEAIPQTVEVRLNNIKCLLS